MGATETTDTGRQVAAGPSIVLPFLWRRMRGSIRPRSGAAAAVAFDPGALAGEAALTWIGHASFLVKMDGVSFLTDPIFSQRASPLRFAGPRRLVAPGIPLESLPHVDFVLISHDHYDHTDLPSVRALARRGIPFVVPRGLGDLVRAAGGKATELGWWDSLALAGVSVHCVPAQHFSGRALTDRNRRLWAGFVVAGRVRRFYHAGDTGYFAGFAEIARRLGRPDLAAIPIGGYLPQEMMRPVHLCPEEAVRAVLDLGARRAVGMHFGTFDLSDEPLDEPPGRFLREAAARGLGDRTFVLHIGETRAF